MTQIGLPMQYGFRARVHNNSDPEAACACGVVMLRFCAVPCTTCLAYVHWTRIIFCSLRAAWHACASSVECL